MNRTRMSHALSGVAALLISASAQAVVTYTFSGTGGDFAGLGPKPVSFTLSVPDFVQASFTSFELGQLSTSSGLGWGPSLILGDASYSAVSISANNNAGYGFIFAPGALQAAGWYTTAAGAFNVGTLTVTGSGPLPAVPEPQSYALLAAGLMAVAWRARSRRQPADPTTRCETAA